ncbi:MAG TPA: hypothetical protein VHA75_21265 [Rugosimonospora sp.]|nr:hypothetical protein [Rugosimonospora sp.]
MSLTARASGTADAGGNLILAFRVVGQLPWTVSQVSIEMDTIAGGTLGAVRFNGFLVSPFVPGADAVGGDPPVTLQPGGDELTVEWTGAPVGAVGTALLIYDPGA